MQHANIKNSFSRSSLTRLLAGLSDQTGSAHPAAAQPAAQPRSLAAGLGAWLDWTQAIALSAVLGDTVATVPRADGAHGAHGAHGAGAAGGTDSAVLRSAAEAVRRVRDASRLAITSDAVLAPTQAADFEACRRRIRVHQQAMATATATLRAQLRAALAGASAAGARLAALDGVMAAALAAREGQLLAGVIGRLEGLDPRDLGRTVQAVLLAELETRLEPAQGLLEALGDAAPDGRRATT